MQPHQATVSNTRQRLGLSELYRQTKAATVAPDQARFNAAKQLITLLTLGGAAGAGYRGLTGLRDTLAPANFEPQVSAQLPQTMQMNPIEEKQADWRDGPAKYLSKMLPFTPTTTKPLMNAVGMPLGIATAGGGLIGGYKLTDWLLNKERERNQKSQVNSAESDYRAALAEQYEAAMQNKQAGDDLGIDALADTYEERREKAANVSQWLNDTSGAAAGSLTTAMLLSALGSGYATYNHVRGRNKQDVLAKALKQRQQQRARLSPPPIVAELPEQREAAA